jgi:hypothetical protein
MIRSKFEENIQEYRTWSILKYSVVVNAVIGKKRDQGQAQAPHVQPKRVLRPAPRPRLYTSLLDPCAVHTSLLI